VNTDYAFFTRWPGDYEAYQHHFKPITASFCNLATFFFIMLEFFTNLRLAFRVLATIQKWVM